MEDLRALEREINRLKTERDGLLKKQQEALVREIPIIGATLIKSQLNPLRNVSFNTVIVDEASQATVTLALLAMLHGKKWIIVGDHRQLLPIFRSLPKPQSEKETVAQEELKNRFGAFTNLYYKYGNERCQWLQWHHRSNDKIIEFAKKYVYEKEIKTVDSCRNIKLKAKGWDVLSKGELLDPDKPVIFIHREGHDMRDGESRYNIEEVETCIELVNMMIKCGISQEEIGVITPYGAQSKELRDSIHERYRRVDVSTVDAFQGNEKDAIIFSLTATSDLKFASNINRLNVALTRPRCKLVVVANGKSIDSENKNLLIHHFLEYANDEKAVFYWDKEMWRANIPKEQVPICIKNGWSICKELDKSTTLIERSIAHFKTKVTSDSQGYIPTKETGEYRPDISTNIVNLGEQGKVNGYLKIHPNATTIEIAMATDIPVRVVTAILALIAKE
jgi:superfamily I DNA and/or RNA helicase